MSLCLQVSPGSARLRPERLAAPAVSQALGAAMGRVLPRLPALESKSRGPVLAPQDGGGPA